MSCCITQAKCCAPCSIEALRSAGCGFSAAPQAVNKRCECEWRLVTKPNFKVVFVLKTSIVLLWVSLEADVDMMYDVIIPGAEFHAKHR